MNLAALQQGDPYITEIIDIAVKVALYKFSQQMNQWSVTDIEGSLFVYKRSASPTYGLMILNTKDFNNLVQPLTHQVEFHLNTPFLLFKKLADDLEDAIHGIWFQDTGECLRLTETIQRILREVSGRGDDKRSTAAPDTDHGPSRAGAHPAKASGPGHNILSLLSQAQNKYEQEHGASQDQADPRPIKHPSGDASGRSHITLDDLFRTVNQHQAKAGLVDAGTDTHALRSTLMARSLSVAEVEAQAHDRRGGVRGLLEGPAGGGGGAVPDYRHPILKLISSKTVEEIERQHLEEHKLKAGGVPPEASPATGHGSRSPAGATESAGMELMQLLGQGGGAKVPSGHAPMPGEGGSDRGGGGGAAMDSAAAVKKLITLQDPHFGTNRGFVPVSLPTTAQSVEDLEMSLTALAPP
ncbi:mRNA-decapping enzyme 1A, partial [Aplysia californica]|uniref:mRNA-decapping enzyme 1A n=1 Tax=Aplysia californica TaxID=6500 RepID=A0ABM1AF31_APLCA